MATSLNALVIRKRLGRNTWKTPTAQGPDGWRFQEFVDGAMTREIIATVASHDRVEWIHASVVRLTDGVVGDETMPTYEDLTEMHHAVFHGGQGYAYQMFVPPSSHVSIRNNALHLWGRLDGRPVMPDFGAALGSI